LNQEKVFANSLNWSMLNFFSWFNPQCHSSKLM